MRLRQQLAKAIWTTETRHFVGSIRARPRKDWLGNVSDMPKDRA